MIVHSSGKKLVSMHMHLPTWHPIDKSNNKMKRGTRLPNQVASMYGSDIQFFEKKIRKLLFDLLSDPLFLVV